MLRNATTASTAVLASKRFSRHARNTEILLVELPQLEQLFNHLSLLVAAADLRDISGILNHRIDIEIGGQAVKDCEENVQNRGLGVCC